MNARTYVSQILTATILIFCAALLLLIDLIPANETYAYSPYAFSILQPESEEMETIDSYTGERYIYTFTVPNGPAATHGLKLSFYLRNTIAEVTLDGETRFSTTELEQYHIGKSPGNYWVNFPFRSDYQGRTVKVSLTPVYKSLRYETPQFLLNRRRGCRIRRCHCYIWQTFANNICHIWWCILMRQPLFLPIQTVPHPLSHRGVGGGRETGGVQIPS